MLRNIKKFFDQHMQAAGAPRAEATQHTLQVATAALLFEVMRADREMRDTERHAVNAAIQSRFALTVEETSTLLHLAQAEADEATDYYQFTFLINQHYTTEQKEQIIECLWQVAAVDHEIDRFERTLIHKIADLLHVSRPAQIAARERALRTVGRETM